MFFMQAIKNQISKKNAEKLSLNQLEKYFETSRELYETLLYAEEITGSKFLGVETSEVNKNPPFNFTAKYPADEHLVAYFTRFSDNELAEKLGRIVEYYDTEASRFVKVVFQIDGYDAYDPDTFDDLVAITRKSIMDKIYKYREKAKEHAANYLKQKREEWLNSDVNDKQ